MAEDKRSKYHKPISISQSSKRNKLTLSSKSDSSVNFLSNSNIGQQCKDEVVQLSSGNVVKSSACEPNSRPATGQKDGKFYEAITDNDVISIKSGSTNQEEDASLGLNPIDKDCNSSVDDTNLFNQESEVQCCSEDSVNKNLRIKNSSEEHVLDLSCVRQASCRTVESLRAGEMLENEDGFNCNRDEEILPKLKEEKSSCDGKVEAWLCNQDNHSPELADHITNKKTIELNDSETEEKISPEFSLVADVDAEENAVSQCPLCWKKLDKHVTSHLKLCAAKHRLSTVQLLEAVQLQKKQTEERRVLGLPAIRPAAVNKKPPAASRKGLSSGDSSLQLALALSASLQEAEEREQDMILESGMTESASLSPSVIQRQLALLENFGFTSSRPALPSCRQKTGVSKIRLKSYPLLNRTKEERERLITEKVAIILMDEEGKDGIPVSNCNKTQDITNVTSQLLLRFQDKGSQLWEMARDTSEDVHKDLYYVQSLASHISPCKVEPGTKLQHLSQIQGRINTPVSKAMSNTYYL